LKKFVFGAAMISIPFNVPPVTGRELEYVRAVIERREFSGNGVFTARSQDWLKNRLGAHEALLTQSCTAALEMAAILADLEPGDEVIMPSFTFVSTANAVVLRRAIPVFVDIRADTLNIDETQIEAAITPRTKAIFAVHYAGICAEMDAIRQLADRHGLIVVEDAAQALLSTYRGAPAGTLGHLGCFSFHETKNVTSGEGGALMLNEPHFSGRAYAVWEKGTNRRAFRAGYVDKYSWVDCGSSFPPSEFTAAIVLAQLEQADVYTQARRVIWNRYQEGFAALSASGKARRPSVPPHCEHNGHLYYLVLSDQAARDRAIRALAADGIATVFHYVPLHSSPAGLRYARAHGSMCVTDEASAGLLRLPLYAGMAPSAADRVIERVYAHLSR
jgi:dTDP-4-amino-4,6-dideoxygalactose transaminase